MTLAPSQPQEEPPFTWHVRPLARGEEGFIFGTWIRSYMSAPTSRRVESEDYYQGQLRIVESILARGAIVRVAEHAVHGNLLGFGVGERHEERPVLHYFYVKGDFRGRGICHDIEAHILRAIKQPGDTVRYTHRQREWIAPLAARRGYRWNPFCTFPPKET